MDTLGQLELWLSSIKADMEDLTVTKHIFHVREASKICVEMGNYIYPFHQMMEMVMKLPMNVMAGYSAGFLRRAMLLQSLNPPAKEKEGKSASGTEPLKKKKKKLLEPEIAPEIIDKLTASKRNKVVLDSRVISPFFPEGLGFINMLIDGNERVEIKGSEFWVSKLSSFQSTLVTFKRAYSDKLDEKRNFWGFILTVLFIYQFPIIWLTGFFGTFVSKIYISNCLNTTFYYINFLILVFIGMNFDDQTYLDPDYQIWYFSGGISFFWVVAGAVYAGILVYSIDAKIVYQAT
jgi:hypothetical protein